MYTIKSTSSEGVYYLVNGRNKARTFWKDHTDSATQFKTAGQARASLTKLLKIMPDYLDDLFEVVEV